MGGCFKKQRPYAVTLKVKIEDFQAARDIVVNFENGDLDLGKE